MVWSWSHSPEAYEAANANLAKLPRKDLEVIYAEWKANPQGHWHPNGMTFDGNFDFTMYERALGAAKHMDDNVLVDRIWGLAEKAAQCSNGGHYCFLCPSGCHTVPFHVEDEDEEP